MGPKEIVRIIEKEIGGDWTISNAHGCDLKECLVRPKRRKFKLFDDTVRNMYVVLEEYPETHEGYNVIFDSASGRFGLGQSTDSRNYVLGFHNSFLAAFKAM
jgi:hypothetical protein